MKPEEIWYSRNPSHDLDMDGNDRFMGTAILCMEDYAKRQCIAFAEWIAVNICEHCADGCWLWRFKYSNEIVNTQELYQRFLKTLNT